MNMHYLRNYKPYDGQNVLILTIGNKYRVCEATYVMDKCNFVDEYGNVSTEGEIISWIGIDEFEKSVTKS